MKEKSTIRFTLRILSFCKVRLQCQRLPSPLPLDSAEQNCHTVTMHVESRIAEDASWFTGRSTALGIAATTLTFVVANATTTWRIGLLSDDFDILRNVTFGFLAAFDEIHWSPILNAVFAAIAQDYLSPQAAHFISSLLHAAVAVASGALLHLTFRPAAWVIWYCVLVWLVTPVASESVWWLCAQGYVWTGLMLVLGLLVESSKRLTRWQQAVCLALLQAGASVSWDWGVVLLPACVAMRTLKRETWKEVARSLGYSLSTFLPMASIWLLHQSLRALLKIPTGYGWLPLGPSRALKDLFLAPVMIFLPDAPLGVRVFLSAILWMLLLRAAVRASQQRALLAVFLLLQVPFMLQGVLQARYLYVSAPLLCVMVLGELHLWAQTRVRRVLFAGMCLCLFAWELESYMFNAGAWRDASTEALKLSRSLSEMMEKAASPVVLVNVPDSYGDPSKRWRPFLWRRGLDTQLPPHEEVFTTEFVEDERLDHISNSISESSLKSISPSFKILRIVGSKDDQTKKPVYTVLEINSRG